MDLVIDNTGEFDIHHRKNTLDGLELDLSVFSYLKAITGENWVMGISAWYRNEKSQVWTVINTGGL